MTGRDEADMNRPELDEYAYTGLDLSNRQRRRDNLALYKAQSSPRGKPMLIPHWAVLTVTGLGLLFLGFVLGVFSLVWTLS